MHFLMLFVNVLRIDCITAEWVDILKYLLDLPKRIINLDLSGLTGMMAPHTPTGSCLVKHTKLSSVKNRNSTISLIHCTLGGDFNHRLVLLLLSSTVLTFLKTSSPVLLYCTFQMSQ